MSEFYKICCADCDHIVYLAYDNMRTACDLGNRGLHPKYVSLRGKCSKFVLNRGLQEYLKKYSENYQFRIEGF